MAEYIKSPYVYFLENTNGKIKVNDIIRRISGFIDINVYKLMTFCDKAKSIEELYKNFSKNTVDDAISNGFIVDVNDVWSSNYYTKVAVEVNTDCNYKCEYCPVRMHPRPKAVMALEVFEKILQNLTKCNHISLISFSIYNEPLLDPLFKERIRLLKNYKMKLALHTNGSLLNREMLNFLKESDVVAYINFNFPYYNAIEYKAITLSDSFSKVCKNINDAIELGFDIEFSVQKIGADWKKNIESINKIFGERINRKIHVWNTVDRGGILNNAYYQNINIANNLSGCSRFLEWLNIDVMGNCLICCHDYFGRHVIGNIIDENLEEIFQKESYRNTVKKIFGATDSDDKFICRHCYEMKIMGIYCKNSENIQRLMER